MSENNEFDAPPSLRTVISGQQVEALHAEHRELKSEISLLGTAKRFKWWAVFLAGVFGGGVAAATYADRYVTFAALNITVEKVSKLDERVTAVEQSVKDMKDEQHELHQDVRDIAHQVTSIARTVRAPLVDHADEDEVRAAAVKAREALDVVAKKAERLHQP